MKSLSIALAGLIVAIAASQASAGRYDRSGWDIGFRFGYSDRGSYYGGSGDYYSGSRYSGGYYDRGYSDSGYSSYRSYDCAPRYYAPRTYYYSAPRYYDCEPRYYGGYRRGRY